MEALTRYPTAQAFLDAVAPALARREDEHNLLWGIAQGRLAEERAGFGDDPILLAHLGPAHDPEALLVMTPPYGVVYAPLRDEVASVSDRAVAAMRAVDLPVAGVIAPAEAAEAFRVRWREQTGDEVRSTVRERLHRADEVASVPIRPGRLLVAGPEHFAQLVDWATTFHAEAVPDDPTEDVARAVGLRIEQGDLFVWEENGKPLGMAGRARRSPNGICVNYVYTPPVHRGVGVATSLVAELTRRLLQEVDFCVLFTDLANPTSNALYRRIGYRPVRDFTLHWFERRAPRD